MRKVFLFFVLSLSLSAFSIEKNEKNILISKNSIKVDSYKDGICTFTYSLIARNSVTNEVRVYTYTVTTTANSSLDCEATAFLYQRLHQQALEYNLNNP